jgi:cytochrome P450
VTGSAANVATLDITSAAFKADPFPTYARLREQSPVIRVHAPRFGPAFLLTRYRDVEAALKDQRLAKNRSETPAVDARRPPRNLPRVLAPLERGLLNLDGSDHDRLRGLVRQAFTPRRIGSMADHAERRVDELLSSATRCAGFDVIGDFALPFSLGLIARILGVPEHETPKFSRWSTALIRSPQRRFTATALPQVLQFLRYLRRHIAERGRDPRDDLISDLATARDGDDRLTDDEILAMVVLLLTAGHETTVNLIASGTLALLQHPDQGALWRENRALAGTGIEELVRFVAPAETATQRYAREHLEIAGAPIPQGALVLAGIASANRDPDCFEGPESVDLTREPNRHLSFGRGAHYCLGAPLARMEGRIALGALFERAPALRVGGDPAALAWRGGLVLRGLEALPVELR